MPRRYTTEEIDRLCYNELVDHDLLPQAPGPVRVDRFVEKRFCEIEYVDFAACHDDEMGDGVLGCCIFDPKGAVAKIRISARLDDGTTVGGRRVRSTIAHEAGHGLMHRSLFKAPLGQLGIDFEGDDRAALGANIDLVKRRILCRHEDICERSAGAQPQQNRLIEWQANCAIGALLLPIGLVCEAISRYTRYSNSLRNFYLPSESRDFAARELAEIFNVNPVVARIRLSRIYPEEDSWGA